MTYLSEEPGHQVSKDDSLVRLIVVGRRGDTSALPQVGFPFVHELVSSLGVNQQDARSAFDEPSPIEHANPPGLHCIHSVSEFGGVWLKLFDFDGGLWKKRQRCSIIQSWGIGLSLRERLPIGG